MKRILCIVFLFLQPLFSNVFADDIMHQYTPTGYTSNVISGASSSYSASASVTRVLTASGALKSIQLLLAQNTNGNPVTVYICKGETYECDWSGQDANRIYTSSSFSISSFGFSYDGRNETLELSSPVALVNGQNYSIQVKGDGVYWWTAPGTSEPFDVLRRFVLGFPLPNLTPYTAGISGVVDHSVSTGFNCANNVVTAYTGEQGASGNGESSWSTTATGSGCSGSLYGLAKASGTFSIGGQYDSYDTGGTSHNVYLFYDGHTGYDYPASDANGGTSVLAAAAGTAYYEGSNYDLKIDHGNGYFTYYLHLQSRTITTDGQTVAKGAEIGKTGSGHLHFTVKKGTTRVDPYGWTGTGSDPLQIDGYNNICLWDVCP